MEMCFLIHRYLWSKVRKLVKILVSSMRDRRTLYRNYPTWFQNTNKPQRNSFSANSMIASTPSLPIQSRNVLYLQTSKEMERNLSSSSKSRCGGRRWGAIGGSLRPRSMELRLWLGSRKFWDKVSEGLFFCFGADVWYECVRKLRTMFYQLSLYIT
jgi:hypothetical protein